MGNPSCKWVRDRLPLLAGAELWGLDLRRVERHLIGCPKCRHQRTSMDQALEVLHIASAESPTQPDSPSLWPGLARQIRESRRPAPAPSFTWPRQFGLWPAFGLSLGLIAAVVAIGARSQHANTPVKIAVRTFPTVAPVAAPAPVVSKIEAPAPSHEATKGQIESASTESVPATRLGYDLDRAMPMPTGIEARDGKHQPTY